MDAQRKSRGNVGTTVYRSSANNIPKNLYLQSKLDDRFKEMSTLPYLGLSILPLNMFSMKWFQSILEKGI